MSDLTFSSFREASLLTAEDASRVDSGSVGTIALPVQPPPVRDDLRFHEEIESPTRSLDFADFPSWLLSLVIHLTLFIIFASLIFPQSNQSGLTTLRMGFAIVESQADSSITILPTKVEEKQAEDSPALEPESAANPNSESKGVSERSPPSDASQPASAKKAEFDFSKVSFKPLGRMASAMLNSARSEQRQSDYDDIVDRFIQYDLGRIRGAAGRQVRDQFESLGSDAIPALVRGVNKSARYNGSCPVAVLSRKLNDELQKTSNPNLVQYAIENLGTDVNWNMPHADRVLALRNQLLNRFSDNENKIESIIDAFQLESSDELVASVSRFSDMSAADLASRLEAMDETDDQVAALIAIRIRFGSSLKSTPKLGQAISTMLESDNPTVNKMSGDILGMMNPGQHFGRDAQAAQVWKLFWQCQETKSRGLLVRSLMETRRSNHVAAMRLFLVSEVSLFDRQKTNIAKAIMPNLNSEYEDVANLTNQVLARLAKGADFGRSEDIWQTYWDEYQRARIDGPVGMSRFRSANSLLSKGKKRAAQKYFERIIQEFPGTKAAALAQQQLELNFE